MSINANKITLLRFPGFPLGTAPPSPLTRKCRICPHLTLKPNRTHRFGPGEDGTQQDGLARIEKFASRRLKPGLSVADGMPQAPVRGTVREIMRFLGTVLKSVCPIIPTNVSLYPGPLRPPSPLRERPGAGPRGGGELGRPLATVSRMCRYERKCKYGRK